MVKLNPGVVLVILLAYFGVKYSEKLSVPTNWFNKPAVVVVDDKRNVAAPAPDLQAVVAPITNVLKVVSKDTTRDHAADCFLVGDLAGDFADVIVKPGLVKTNKAIREGWKSAGLATIDNHVISNNYPGSKEALDGAISSTLGLDNAPADMTKAYNIFKAIQWAAYQAVK